MADEIMIGETGLVSLTENQDIGTLIQPLQREIELFDSYVAGTTHLKEREVLETIAIGDQLSLVREENLYDEFAVLIRTEKGREADGCGEAAYSEDYRDKETGEFLFDWDSNILTGFLRLRWRKITLVHSRKCTITMQWISQPRK